MKSPRAPGAFLYAMPSLGLPSRTISCAPCGLRLAKGADALCQEKINFKNAQIKALCGNFQEHTFTICYEEKQGTILLEVEQKQNAKVE